MGIGEKLKNARLEQGHSLEAVEEETKIRKYYLEAIENDNYGVLPAKVYATGFVKRYAKFLGLDEQECSEVFKNGAYGPEQKEESIEIVSSKTSQFGSSNISLKNVIVAIVFLVAVIWAGDYLITYFTKEHTLPPNSGTPIVEPHNQDENTSDDNTDNDVVEPVEVNGVEIIVQANQNCWLNILVDGELQYNNILNEGETLTFKGEETIYLKAGNAGGIIITYNGKEMPVLGQYREVKEATYTSY